MNINNLSNGSFFTFNSYIFGHKDNFKINNLNYLIKTDIFKAIWITMMMKKLKVENKKPSSWFKDRTQTFQIHQIEDKRAFLKYLDRTWWDLFGPFPWDFQDLQLMQHGKSAIKYVNQISYFICCWGPCVLCFSRTSMVNHMESIFKIWARMSLMNSVPNLRKL